MSGALLKFNGPTEYAIRNIENGEIFFQHYSAYNDPFEFRTRILDGIPDTKQQAERFLAALNAWGFDLGSIKEATDDPGFLANTLGYFDECKDYSPQFMEMCDEMRIACFGSERNNLLMWSHYADGLRGFCIVFDEELVVNCETEAYAVDVAYLDAPPAVDALVYGISQDQLWYHDMVVEEESPNPSYEKAAEEAFEKMKKIWQHVFAAKPAEWEYEKERRLLVQTQKSDRISILRPYPREAVKEVIIGERMPPEFKKRLLIVIRKHYENVPVLIARRAEGRYVLTFS